MPKCTYEKDRALAEIYTYILVEFERFKDGSISKRDYEQLKRIYLYDKSILKYFIRFLKTAPEICRFADKNQTALDVLNDLMVEGAINLFEYYTLKERHLLY